MGFAHASPTFRKAKKERDTLAPLAFCFLRPYAPGRLNILAKNPRRFVGRAAVRATSAAAHTLRSRANA